VKNKSRASVCGRREMMTSAYHTLKFSRFSKIKKKTNNINFNNDQLHKIILISHIHTTSFLLFHSIHVLQFLRAECPFTSTFSKKILKLQHLHKHSFYEIIIFNNFKIICFNFKHYNTSTFILTKKQNLTYLINPIVILHTTFLKTRFSSSILHYFHV
jgi:hypothetical protein